MKKLSVVILAIVGILVLLASMTSAYVAYSGNEAGIPYGGVKGSELAAGRPEVLTALESRRGTAAAFGAGFATFFLFVVFGPYRRGDVWAFWALLAATGISALVSGARVVFLGTSQGAGVAGVMLAVVIIGLLCDAGRLKGRT